MDICCKLLRPQYVFAGKTSCCLVQIKHYFFNKLNLSYSFPISNADEILVKYKDKVKDKRVGVTLDPTLGDNLERIDPDEVIRGLKLNKQ